MVDPAPPAAAAPPSEPSGGAKLSAQVHLGDCVQGMRALADGSVDLLIADPPYDIGVHKAKWDTVPHYLEWSRTWLAEAQRVLRPGGQLFIYGSPAKLWISRLKILAADEFGFDFKQHISWCYKQGGDSRFAGMVQYAVRMEHLEWFVKPAPDGGAHTFNAHEAAEKYTPEEKREALAKGVGRVTEESLRQGRPPRNWVEIPRENSKSVERRYGAHPSMKPLAICERLVRVHSRRGDRVLIPFGGSGSEVVAAAKLRRSAICFESDPAYHRIIVRRLAGHGVRAIGADGAEAAVTEVAAPAAARTALGAIETSGKFASGYKGVFKQGARFVAKIRIGGKLVSLGSFAEAHAAAVAYQARAVAEGHLPAPPPAEAREPAAAPQRPSAAGGEASAGEAAQPQAKKRGRKPKQPEQPGARTPLAPVALGAALLANGTCAPPAECSRAAATALAAPMRVVVGIPIAQPRCAPPSAMS